MTPKSQRRVHLQRGEADVDAIEIGDDVEQEQERQQTTAGFRERGCERRRVPLHTGVPEAVARVSATRARITVLWFAFLLAVITYLDRVCISAAAPFIMDDLHLTIVQMGVVFSAFTLAYSLFEIPSGWLGDVNGPRRVLTRIVLWWSAFTMLTGAARGLPVARRHPVPVRRRRGRRVSEHGAQLLAMVSAARARQGQRRDVLRIARRRHAVGADRAAADRAGAGARASSSSARSASCGRRRGSCGIAIGPADIRRSNAEELAWIQQDAARRTIGARRIATPWRALLRSRNLYAICAMYFAFGYGLYFYFTWLPTYLIRELGFSVLGGGAVRGAAVSAAPASPNLAGGWLTDCARARAVCASARCGLGFGAFFACARADRSRRRSSPQPIAKAVLLALALGVGRPRARRVLGGAASTSRRDHAGVVTGCMNTFGNLGGLLDAARRRHRGRSLAVVDVSVLRHRGRLRRRRADVAGDTTRQSDSTAHHLCNYPFDKTMRWRRLLKSERR